MSDSISFLPYNNAIAARDYLHRLITVLLALSSSYGRVASTIHNKAIRHFPQNNSNTSPASHTPSHFGHNGINMVNQPDVMGLPQMQGAYSMPVQNGMTAPAGQMNGSQFPTMLADVTSAEYMAFGSHHASAGAGQQSAQTYASYRYMD
jgi:hypothetical protein